MDLSLALQIVFLVSGAASLTTAIVLLGFRRNRKGIGYEVLSIEPLIEKKKAAEADRLEIRFDGRPIPEPHLVRVRVCNAERSTLRKEDFRKPITIAFDDVDVYRFTPPECDSVLAPETRWDVPHQVSIEPMDLNEGASIILTALVSRRVEAGHIRCSTMIIDGYKDGVRLLNVGAPPVLQWLGIAIKWVLGLGVAGGLLIFAWFAGHDLFEDGVAGGLLKIVTLLGVSVGPVVLIGIVVRLLNRGRWPYYLR
jgi:hypothetical protein